MSHNIIDHIAIVLLAAGESKRLGSPKQLLAYQNESLLQRSINNALAAKADLVIVVTGANHEKIESLINAVDVTVLRNHNWQNGMSSSLRAALRYINNNHSYINGILVMVCDQPFANATILKQLISLQKDSGLPIAASSYANRLGTPALFHKGLFPLLQNIEGDKGARKILEENKELVAVLSFEKGEFDIDTIADYNKLLTTTN